MSEKKHTGSSERGLVFQNVKFALVFQIFPFLLDLFYCLRFVTGKFTGQSFLNIIPRFCFVLIRNFAAERLI